MNVIDGCISFAASSGDSHQHEGELVSTRHTVTVGNHADVEQDIS